MNKLIGWFIGLLVAAGLGVVLAAPGAQAACVALPTDKGQATFNVTIPTTGSYRLWSRMSVPSSSANGYYLQIDQSTCNAIVGHGSTIPANQLTWVDWMSGNPNTKFDVSLTAGTHAVVAAGLDAGVELDEIMFVSDKTCVPTGTGVNCASSGAVVATPTATPKPTITPVLIGSGSATSPVVSGKISLASASSAVGVSTQYLVDGKPISGSQLDTTALSDGTHTVKVVSTAADGTTTVKSQTIEVQNGWQYKLVAGMQRFWPLTAGGLVLLVGFGFGGATLWRNRLRNSLKPPTTPTIPPTPMAPLS